MSTELKPLLKSIFANVQKDLQGAGALPSVSSNSDFLHSKVFLAIGFGVMLLAVFGILPDILTTLFGMLYPAYMSYKAIEKGLEEQKKVWLTYWIVFGFLSTIDDSFGFFLEYIPGFYSFRFLVYIWMFYPRANNGATTIYVALKPMLQTVKQKIETLFKQAKTE